MFPASMVKVTAVVMNRYASEVSEAILKVGALQLTEIEKAERILSELVKETKTSDEETKNHFSEIRKKSEDLLLKMGIKPEIPIKLEEYRLDPDDFSKEALILDEVREKLQSVLKRKERIEKEINLIESFGRDVSRFGIEHTALARGWESRWVDFSFGRVEIGKREQLEENVNPLGVAILWGITEAGFVYGTAVYLKRNREEVREKLKDSGWEEIGFPSDVKTREEASRFNEIVRLRKELEKLTGEFKEIKDRYSRRLFRIWVAARMRELLGAVEKYFAKTSKISIFSGWIPAYKLRELLDAIDRVTGGNCYIEWRNPTISEIVHSKVPVLVKNPKFMSPFQMLVTNYGAPSYKTIDPTPFMMVFYLIMFGLMFADACQGAIVALAGLLILKLFKPKRENFKNLFHLMIWCGGFSIIAGVLFGSYFGKQWISPVLFSMDEVVKGTAPGGKIINDIYDILGISVFFGLFILSVGIIFNWINSLLLRDWKGLIFSKGGLLGAWIFFGGIYSAYYMIKNDYKALPPGFQLLFLLVIPSFLFVFEKPFENILSGKARIKEGEAVSGGGIFTFFMEWGVKLLEVFSGYLSNSLSFMRIAGFGIAHVTLMDAFYEMADMVRGTGGIISSIIIMIFGNILVICLEGLSVGIQSLRLNYYEFFTKFYRTTGLVFKPITISREL